MRCLKQYGISCMVLITMLKDFFLFKVLSHYKVGNHCFRSSWNFFLRSCLRQVRKIEFPNSSRCFLFIADCGDQSNTTWNHPHKKLVQILIPTIKLDLKIPGQLKNKLIITWWCNKILKYFKLYSFLHYLLLIKNLRCESCLYTCN